jgi:serine/alanine adding enzyme
VVGQSQDEAVPRVNLVLQLQQDEEAQWKALSAKVRNQTRKAERQDLVLADGVPDELLHEFYEPFQVNMRDLGSPVHGLNFFRSASQHLGERFRFVVTRLGSRPVGGLVAIRYGRSVTVPWASTLRSERNRCPNNLIYWEAIRWAVEQGATKFDFGRSPQGSGTHRFKLGWGAAEEPLAWVRLDSSGNVMPMTIGSENGALSRASGIWMRLPVAVAGVIGPRLRRYFSN